MTSDLSAKTFKFSPLLDPREGSDQKLIDLYDWWLAQRRDGQAMPSWSNVDVIDLKRWMGLLTIYQLLPDGSDAIFKLVGTRIVEAAGFDLTGKRLSAGSYTLTPEIVLANLHRISSHAHACVQTNPIMIAPTGFAKPSERLWMPFSEDGQHVDRILLYYHRVEIIVTDHHQGSKISCHRSYAPQR